MAHHIRMVGAGQGTHLDAVDSVATEKVAAADSDGTYELFEIDAPAGSGIPPHRHGWAEAYYVLDGALDVVVGARTFHMGPGDTVSVPPRAAHTFTVRSATCRFLSFSLGDGAGRLFADLDLEVPDGPPAEAVPVVIAVAERHGVTFLVDRVG
jgi:mannose-6-phosphate isomerase-like protein (cupin superfamily)